MKEFVGYDLCLHNSVQKAWTWIHTGLVTVEDGSVSPHPGEPQFLFSHPARISGQFEKWSAERKPQSLLGNPLN